MELKLQRIKKRFIIIDGQSPTIIRSYLKIYLSFRFMSLACSGDVMEVEKILSNPLLIPDNNALLIGKFLY